MRSLQGWLSRWIQRRGPVHPPLLLGYRQVYILPTRFGWLVALLLFAMLLGSLNFNNNLGLFTTFLVAGIGLLSMHIAHRNLEGIRVQHCQAEPVFAGQDLQLIITLQDARKRARSGLIAEIRPLRRSRGVGLQRSGRAELGLPVPTRQRGWMNVPRIRLRTRYPLGWFEAWSWFWPRQRFLVWPQPADHAPGLPHAADQDRHSHPGDESDEFHGLREWREGDPLHRIAWKASQRHQTLLARRFTRPDQGQLLLRLADAPGASLDERIAILTRWVIDADRGGFEYGLDLGATSIAAAAGDQQRVKCLNALAELG
ncbi:MAG: DUF58 domain-containing protein [Wenzhouxiangellaceae bacterium]|nr:DUF58 domain-containing protein [Wenzhouxiangellaceae bacterium]